MSQPENFELVVLGSGEAGKCLAWSLASQGKRAIVVDRRYIGGSCPNVECLPSRNVIHSAQITWYFRRGAEFGIAAGDWKVEMSGVRNRVTTGRQVPFCLFTDPELARVGLGESAARQRGVYYRLAKMTHPTMAEGLIPLFDTVPAR